MPPRRPSPATTPGMPAHAGDDLSKNKALLHARSLSRGLKYFIRGIVKARGADYTVLDSLL
jgi:hypothetical protein